MGTLYKNGIPYGGGGGDNSKTITYEDYKNLPEAERKNGTTYYVPDYPGGMSASFILLLDKVGDGIHNANNSMYDDFYVELLLNGDNGVILPFRVQKIKRGKKYRLAFSNEVYANITFNDSTIAVNTAIGTYDSISVTIYGMGYSDISGGSTDIVDNLDSTDTDKALSANMGRELKEEIEKNKYARTTNLPNTLGEASYNKPWLELKSQFNSMFYAGTSVQGDISAGGHYHYTGNVISANYASFIIHGYADGIMHVYKISSTWYCEKFTSTPIAF